MLLAHHPAGLTTTGRIQPRPGWPELAAASGIAPGTLTTGWDDQITAERARLLATPGGYNEPRLAPASWHHNGHAQLTLQVYVTDYAAWQVARRRWHTLEPSARAQLPAGRQPVPLFTQAVSLSATVLTADRQLVLTRRAATLSYAGCWLSSAAEGLTPADAPGGTLDLRSAARRAAAEELGLTGDLPARVHALVYNPDGPCLEVTTSIDLTGTDITYADVVHAHQSAPDGWEAAELAPLPLTVAAVRAACARRDWMPAGRVHVAITAADHLGIDIAALLPDGAVHRPHTAGQRIS